MAAQLSPAAAGFDRRVVEHELPVVQVPASQTGHLPEHSSSQLARVGTMKTKMHVTVSITLVVALLILAGCDEDAPEPTPEAEPEAATATEAAQELTSGEVVAAFTAAGLEAQGASPMTPADFGAAPMKTDDATRFLIPSLGPDSGGRAFVFDDLEDLRDTKAYYDDIGEESARLFSWTFANEDLGVLVQINGELPEEEAREYEEVVDQLSTAS